MIGCSRKLIKTTTNIFHSYSFTPKYAFSRYFRTAPYPYVFGGLKNVQFVPDVLSQETLKQCFSSQTLQGFKQAYKFTLQTLASKDLDTLEKICEHHLTDSIRLNDVKLINQDAPIQAICVKNVQIIGCQFQRKGSMDLMEKKIDDNNIVYTNLKTFTQNSIFYTMKRAFTGEMPVLTAYEVLFKSSMKLIPGQHAKQSNSQQIHSVQFEIMSNLRFSKYFTAISKIKPDLNQVQHLWKDIVRTQFQWKIGDVDRVLKGNIGIQQ